MQSIIDVVGDTASTRQFMVGGEKASELNHWLNNNGFNTHITDEQAKTGGDAIAYTATTALGAAMLNQVPKAFGGKRSVIDIVRGLSSSSDSELIGKSESQTNNNKQPNSSEPNHSETPRTTNFAGQPNENHPINQPESKGILSKFREFFKSPKEEKLIEVRQF